MSLHLYNSNRLDILAEAFTGLVSNHPLAPMLSELVVLQSGGMARWLSMQVAEQTGICANLDCPFPNQFIDRIFRTILPEDLSPSFDRAPLQWQLMKVLPSLLSEPGFAALAGYLKDAGDVKLFRLAGRLADLFDQYMIFRPEMILAWENGEDAGWQAALWRYLRGSDEYLKNVSHRAELRGRCLQALADGNAVNTLEQGRFSVFGLSSLPVFHLEILTALSEYLDVHFFFMNPCREFWDDIVPAKVIDKLALDHQLPTDLYYQEGNPLLAASGRQGRELLSILHSSGDWEEHDLFENPLAGDNVSALRIVQSDILNMRSGAPETGLELSPADRSIQCHACHSPMRELEVLHDQILRMFIEDPELEPKDILVMTPDIEFYSPLIQTVFAANDESAVIPFSIADRKLRSEGDLVRAFQDVLDLRKSRMEVSRVLAILEHDAVRRKYSFSRDDLERIEKWLVEVNIRWAVDSRSKSEMGLPEIPDNTWRQGFDRLLLGYAMAGEGSRTFGGILPADNVEGNETEILGRFMDLAERIFSCQSELRERRNLDDWADLLVALLADIFDPDNDQQPEFTQLVELFTSLKEQQTKTDFAAPVDFGVIQSFLDKYLAEGGLSSGFMTGAVTFCELLPMRAVPFKCICLLGMNEGDFPRISSAPGFDLIASHPRMGDRSKKSDDRYLFLETILSARDVLYISWVGQSNKDDSELLPSVLVSELLEYLAPLVNQADGKEAWRVTRHPLHGFNRRYFAGDDRLINYSEDDFQACQSLSVNKGPSRLVEGVLPELPEERKSVALEDLVRFFRNPAEFFCRQRLGLFLDQSDHVLEGTESFTVDFLQRYKTGNWLLERVLSGEMGEENSEILRLQGTMPHGSVGKVEIARLEREVLVLADKVSSLQGDGCVRLAEGIVWVDDFTISGEVNGCRETGNQIMYRFAKVNAADEACGWVRHLFYNCLTEDPGKQTVVIGNDKTVIFEAVPDCQELLSGLLETYWLGMRKPLSFFPKSSLVYAEELERKGEAEAFARAASAWRGNDFIRGEGEDPYHKLCLRGVDPFDEEFTTLAVRFFSPLVVHRSLV